MSSKRSKHTVRYSELRQEIIRQLDHALRHVLATRSLADQKIHKIRLRCKRIRALLGLLSSRDGKASKLAAGQVRDGAGLLSAYRDSQIVSEAIEQIQPRLDVPIDLALLTGGESNGPAEMSAQLIELGRALRDVEFKLKRARRIVQSKSRKRRSDRCGPEILLDAYRAGRQRTSRLSSSAKSRQFHALRKAVKLHLYQCEFFASNSDVCFHDRIEQLNQLAQWLGQLQDITVLRDIVDRRQGTEQAVTDAQTILDACRDTASEIRDKVISLAHSLYFDSTKCFAEKVRSK